MFNLARVLFRSLDKIIKRFKMSELALDSKSHQEQLDLRIENMKKGFPSGPLDSYRKQASFEWFEMKVFLEGGEDISRFKLNIWNTLEKDPLFDRVNDHNLSFDERRKLTMKRCTRLAEYNFLTDDELMANPLLAQAFNDSIGAYDWSLSSKYLLNRQVGVNQFFQSLPVLSIILSVILSVNHSVNFSINPVSRCFSDYVNQFHQSFS